MGSPTSPTARLLPAVTLVTALGLATLAPPKSSAQTGPAAPTPPASHSTPAPTNTPRNPRIPVDPKSIIPAKARPNVRPPVPVRHRPGENFAVSTNQAAVRPLAPGVFQFGWVRLDQTRNEIGIPVAVNQREGPLEYLVVTSEGKLHESVLRTEAQPYHIHTAMLLLGAVVPPATAPNPNPAAEKQPAESGQIRTPSPDSPAGVKVTLEIAWDAEGREVRIPAGDLVRNKRKDTSLGAGSWVYNGSRMGNDRFLAQTFGLVAALVTDANALVNSTAEGHADDELWTVNTPALPPPGTPLELILRPVTAPPQPPAPSTPQPSPPTK